MPTPDAETCNDTLPPHPLAVTDDAFLGGALRLWQPHKGHRAGVDAVLLAAAVPARVGRSERVLDAGAGCGIVGLAVALRVPDVLVTAVEIEPELADLVARNAARNGLGDRCQVVAADLAAPGRELRALGLEPGSFDHVVANPPYYLHSESRLADHPLKRRANAMADDGLERWIRFMASMTRHGGTATLVHRAEALPRLLARLERRFGGLAVFPLFPRAGQPAGRILVQGVKGSRAPLRLMPGLVLHAAGGGFLPAADALLRDIAALDLGAAPERP